MTVVCKLCGQPIEQPRSAWKESAGWVSPRGSESMIGRHDTGDLAHAECISLLRAGVNVAQEALV